MNSALTPNLLKTEKSIENNALASSSDDADGLSNELFSEELAVAIEDILAVDGKLKPLDLAALKELGIEQITDLEELSGVQLPAESLSEFIELQKNQLLATDNNILEASESIEEVSLLGHPDAITLFKPGEINNSFSESDLFNNRPEKSITLNNRTMSDVMQQSAFKKEPELAQVFNESDVDFSKAVKELFAKEPDISKELLLQTNKQEVNTTKLVEQLSSLEKPVTLSNPVNNHSLKTYSSSDSSTAFMNRIEVPVTQPNWGDSVGNRLMMMVNGKMQSANIHLNPAELGPIEIKISVNQEHATVHFVSNNSVVRDAIEEAFPRLKEMFMQNGLSLSDANVSQQSPQQGNQYTSQQNDSLSEIGEDPLETIDINQTDNNRRATAIGFVDDYV